MQNRSFQADDRLNQLNDRDDMWGPLLFLRPARHEVISPTRTLILSGILGTFYGMLGNVVICLLLRTGVGYQPPVLLLPLLLTTVYFVCGQLSLVGAWNRRAHRQSRRLDWAELTARSVPPPGDDEQAAE